MFHISTPKKLQLPTFITYYLYNTPRGAPVLIFLSKFNIISLLNIIPTVFGMTGIIDHIKGQFDILILVSKNLS